MADAITGETNKDRAKLAREAGIGKLSLLAILAGAVTAFGTFAILLAVISAIAGAVVANTDFGTLDWRSVGIGAGITIALALLVAYLFGGYVAGRMARRAGWLNGLAVFVLAILVPAILAAILSSQADQVDPSVGPTALGNLRSIGVPTSGDEWAEIGTIVGLGSLLAMLAGSVLGGILGERWHGKLPRPVHTETRTVVDRADPDVHPQETTPAFESEERTPPRDSTNELDERDLNQTTRTDGGGASRTDRPRS
jgi:hypothetical protein